MSVAERILDERPRVSGTGDARALIENVLDALSALAHLVGEETELVRVGRLPEAMTREARKAELAGIYMRGVEQVKLNAVALARFAPEQVKRLKEAHHAFQNLIETNQLVLATARAVSESVIRDLAADANKPMRANGYGPAATVGAGVFSRPNSGPLVVSRRL